MVKILISLIFLFTNQAWAIVGTHTTSEKFDPVCKITMRSKTDGHLYATCTGTLVSSNTVTTAAHCLFKDATYTVECGQVGLDLENLKTEITTASKRKVYTSGIIFKERHQVKQARKDFAYYDKAELKLATTSKLKPAKLTSILRLKALLNQNLCYFSGYGISNNQSSGTLNSVRITRSNLSIDQNHHTFQFTIPKVEIGSGALSFLKAPSAKTIGSITSGDSGSSVICKSGAQLLSFGVANSGDRGQSEPYSMTVKNTFSFSLKEDLKL